MNGERKGFCIAIDFAQVILLCGNRVSLLRVATDLLRLCGYPVLTV